MPDHGRQLEVVGHRGGPEVRAGQGRSSTRSASRKARRTSSHKAAHRPALRRGRGGHGLRRGGPGRHRRAQGRDLPARLPRSSPSRSASIRLDIIFDPNILAIATGIEEHADYADQLHRGDAHHQGSAARASRSAAASATCRSRSAATTSVREAMNAAFLYHAIKAGMDMGIVNAGQLAVYEDIPKDLLEHVEDVLFNRRPDATERLVEFAEHASRAAGKKREADLGLARRTGASSGSRTRWCTASSTSSRRTSRRRGRSTQRPLDDHRRAADGRHEDRRRPVRRRQDVPAAGGQERARDEEARSPTSLPFMEAGEAENGGAARRARCVLATVKGDVHDIGKNIVGVVLGCNNYEVIDLGVMVPGDEDPGGGASTEKADIIGLSGLITPSLDEMVHVAKEMKRQGFTLPLLIGGATTSRQHTAVKIAPEYHGAPCTCSTRRGRWASSSTLLDPTTARRLRRAEPRASRRGCASARRKQEKPLLPFAPARAQSPAARLADRRRRRAGLPRPARLDVPLAELVPLHRLDVLLRRLGAEGQVPGDPRAPAVRRRRRAISTTTRGSCSIASSTNDRSPPAASTASGRRRRVATTSCSTPATIARHVARALPDAAPAGSRSPTTSRTARSPTSSRRRERRGRPRRRVRGHGGPRRRRAGARLRGRPRRLPGHHGEGARRSAGRGVRRVPARAGAARLGLRRGRGAVERGADRREVSRHPARRSAIRRAPITPRRRRCSRCSTPGEVGMALTESFAMMPPASVSGIYLAHPDARYFIGRPHRPGSGRGLRRAEGDVGRGGRALARPESRLRPGVRPRRRRLTPDDSGVVSPPLRSRSILRRVDGGRSGMYSFIRLDGCVHASPIPDLL